MRDGRGILVSACLASVKRLGGELDTPPCGFKERNQKGSPRPADAPSRTGQPVVEADGKSQGEAVTLEVKHGQPEASLALPGRHQALSLEEPLGRESAAAADGSQAAGLCSAPAGERPAGASHGIREAPGSHWPRRGPRAAVSHAGQCPRGEFRAAVWPGHPEPWETGFLKGSLPSRFPKEQGMEWQLSCLSYELSWLPRTCLEVLKDEATWVSPGLYLKPMFLEPTTEFEKTPSSTSDGLQITPRLLALRAVGLAGLPP